MSVKLDFLLFLQGTAWLSLAVGLLLACCRRGRMGPWRLVAGASLLSALQAWTSLFGPFFDSDTLSALYLLLLLGVTATLLATPMIAPKNAWSRPLAAVAGLAWLFTPFLNPGSTLVAAAIAVALAWWQAGHALTVPPCRAPPPVAARLARLVRLGGLTQALGVAAPALSPNLPATPLLGGQVLVLFFIAITAWRLAWPRVDTPPRAGSGLPMVIGTALLIMAGARIADLLGNQAERQLRDVLSRDLENLLGSYPERLEQLRRTVSKMAPQLVPGVAGPEPDLASARVVLRRAREVIDVDVTLLADLNGHYLATNLRPGWTPPAAEVLTAAIGDLTQGRISQLCLPDPRRLLCDLYVVAPVVADGKVAGIAAVGLGLAPLARGFTGLPQSALLDHRGMPLLPGAAFQAAGEPPEPVRHRLLTLQQRPWQPTWLPRQRLAPVTDSADRIGTQYLLQFLTLSPLDWHAVVLGDSAPIQTQRLLGFSLILMICALLLGTGSGALRARQGQAEAARSERRLRQIIDQAPVAVLQLNESGDRILAANDRALTLTGYDLTGLRRLSPSHLLGGSLPASGTLRRWRSRTEQLRHTEIVWLQLTGDEPCRIVFLYDLTERLQLEQALENGRERLERILNSAAEGIFEVDRRGICRFCNAEGASMLGYPDASALRDKNLHDLIHHHQAAHKCPLLGVMDSGHPAHVDYEPLFRADGSQFFAECRIAPIRQGTRITGAVYLITDISARREAEEQLRFLASHDPLTGLPNRAALVQTMTDEIEQARQAGARLAILILDLAQLKTVNDTLGHAVGDELLQLVARQIRQAVGPAPYLARFGGDEFVLLQPAGDLPRPEDLAQRILQVLIEPLRVQGHDLLLGGSVGIALYPAHGEDPETLLTRADAAVHQAKREKPGSWRMFSPDLRAQADRRLRIPPRLKRALREEVLELYYQPIVQLQTGEILALEALSRWQDEELGPVSPAEFIPVAETTGLIVPLGVYVLETACRQGAEFLHRTGAAPCLAINVSARQLAGGRLVPTVAEILERTRWPAHALEIELTEGVIMENVAENIQTLHALRDLGVRLALDDFGTGYSSLSYLKSFPIDKLKIDRAFVTHLTEPGSQDAALCGAVITLCRGLGIRVVAEGIETQEQAERLAELGCQEGQGFWLGRPQPWVTLEPHLRAKGQKEQKEKLEYAG